MCYFQTCCGQFSDHLASSYWYFLAINICIHLECPKNKHGYFTVSLMLLIVENASMHIIVDSYNHNI